MQHQQKGFYGGPQWTSPSEVEVHGPTRHYG